MMFAYLRKLYHDLKREGFDKEYREGFSTAMLAYYIDGCDLPYLLIEYDDETHPFDKGFQKAVSIIASAHE